MQERSASGGYIYKIAYGSLTDINGESVVTFGDFATLTPANASGLRYDFDGDRLPDTKAGNVSKGTQENVDDDGNPAPLRGTKGEMKTHESDTIDHVIVYPSSKPMPAIPQSQVDVNGDGLYDTQRMRSEWFIRTINGATVQRFKKD